MVNIIHEGPTYQKLASMPWRSIRWERRSRRLKLKCHRSPIATSMLDSGDFSRSVNDKVPSIPCRNMLKTHWCQGAIKAHSLVFNRHQGNPERCCSLNCWSMLSSRSACRAWAPPECQFCSAILSWASRAINWVMWVFAARMGTRKNGKNELSFWHVIWWCTQC